jgi:hypothetical protein
VEAESPGGLSFKVPTQGFSADFHFHEDVLTSIRLVFVGLPLSFGTLSSLLALAEAQTALLDIEGPGLQPAGPAYELYAEMPSLFLALSARADAAKKGFICPENDEVLATYIVLHSQNVDPFAVLFSGSDSRPGDPSNLTELSSADLAAALQEPHACVTLLSGY